APRRLPLRLPLRHARRLITDPTPSPGTDPTLLPLLPGEEQLLSFYAPSLTAGAYTATAVQTVTAPTADAPLTLTTTQGFSVTASRFALPTGAVHSVYPPQGHGDHVETLPHMVFNDAHLPWEREATVPAPTPSPTPPSPTPSPPQPDRRNRVPWLAVLSFTADELAIAPADLAAGGIFDATSLTKPVVQTATMTVSMSVADVLKTTATASPIAVVAADPAEQVAASTTMTDAVFLPAALFAALFTSTDAAGVQVADVDRYKYLSHARSINTTGMAAASQAGDSGVFSVVLSHRTGPVDSTATQPAPVIVHLVSIEGVPGMTFPLAADIRYVAMTSLYSWTYTCLPPNADNIYQTLEALGAGLGLLRPPDAIITAAAAAADAADAAADVAAGDGYTLVRWRTQTGEETSALFRGALTPTAVPRPLISPWTSLSNSGMDLQVLDQEVGLMDITYSAAWQLGRTLGMADRAFVTALARVRGAIYDGAMALCKGAALNGRIPGAYGSREETLCGLVKGVETLRGLPGGGRLHAPGGMLRRWRHGAVDIPDLRFGGDSINPADFAANTVIVARQLAASTDGGVYNELNTPANTDWMTVLKWAVDRMYLAGIPAQYLISDRSHLPAEALRFFTVDRNWVDALLDGALSLANHTVDTTDQVRIAIKTAINDYLTTPLPMPAPAVPYLPQVPSYGFLLRSQAIVQFPDLVVITSPLPATGTPLLRHENIADDTMLCLLDREPGSAAFSQLTFRQPPHQQSFVAAAALTAENFTTVYKRVYTQANPTYDPAELYSKTWTKGEAGAVFDWGTRTLLFPAWPTDVYTTISTQMAAQVGPDAFVDTEATAALCGIQLNNPIYSIDITPPPPPPSSSSAAVLQELTAGGAAPPRTLLLLLDPPKRPRALLHTLRASSTPPPPPPAIQDIPIPPLPPPSSRTRLTPLPAPAPPPYNRRILPAHPSSRMTTTPPPIPPPPPSTGATPARPPIFTYTVSPAAAPGPIPTFGIGKQDLVFGIVLSSGSNTQYRLRSIELSLPLGSIDDPAQQQQPAFAVSYDGPGAAMLSNLRFNVAVEFGKKHMVMRLLPRTTRGWVPVAMCAEVSFGLGWVLVKS
ncbi:hypothetical protein DFP73DRAFT_620666, partial [Morchella snyderi]